MDSNQNLKKELENGLSLLLKKKEIQEEEIKKVRKVTIITPYPLKESEKQLFHERFPYLKNAVIENKIDKSLIGGFIIKIGSEILNASIKGTITHLVNKLYESS